MLPPELRILLGKEWRQLLRNRAALLTSTLLPLFLLLIVPAGQMLTLGFAPPDSLQLPPGLPLPPGLAGLDGDPRALMRGLLLPLFVAVAGLVVPATNAIYLLIAEREQRTIELLVALPIRIEHILFAKLLVIALFAGGMTLSLFAIDAVLILALGIGTPLYVAALLLLLLGALSYAIASGLLISLLARDFRAANNLSGVLVVPAMLLSMIVLMSLANPVLAVSLLGVGYACAAGVVTLWAVRVVTFERLLS